MVSLSVVLPQVTHLFRRVSGNGGTLQFFSNVCSTRSSAVEIRKNRMRGRFPMSQCVVGRWLHLKRALIFRAGWSKRAERCQRSCSTKVETDGASWVDQPCDDNQTNLITFRSAVWPTFVFSDNKQTHFGFYCFCD